MDLTWSLKELYSSFEAEEFERDLNELKQLIEQLRCWPENNLGQEGDLAAKIENYLKLKQKYYEKYYLLRSFSYLKLSVDVNNQQASEMTEKLEKLNNKIRGTEVKFQQWLGKLDNLEQLIDSSDFLAEHKFIILELAKQSKYLLNESEEVLLSKLRTTGSKAWNKLKGKLTANLMVDIKLDGEQKQLPLSEVRNLAYEKDAEVRKKAYEAELKSYQKVEKSVASCLNSIKGESLTILAERGFNSALDKSLNDSRLEKQALDAMIEAMEESLDDFRSYYKKKAEVLGHDSGLPFYDLFAPVGEAEMEFEYGEAKDFIVENFNSYSSELGEFARQAFEQNWIDAKPRQGKRGGAFCMNLTPIGESRILANFTGSFSDVSTLAHELGHGFHGHQLKDESILNTNYTMPLAETASIFCETIITEAALKEADDQQAFSILENSLLSAGQVIVDIYSRFIFESEVFKRREESSLSVEQLKELMIEAQKKAYGDGLDHDYLHPYMWVNKSHYYRPGFDFYNYPYAFGLLFGKGLYAQYLKQGDEFIDKYNQLLKLTGKRNVVEVAKEAGIDATKIDFWQDSLALIKEDIERFIEYADRL